MGEMSKRGRHQGCLPDARVSSKKCNARFQKFRGVVDVVRDYEVPTFI